MAELIESLAAGILWAAPCILLAALVGRAVTGSFGSGMLVAYPLFFGLQVLLSKLLGAAGLLTTPALLITYGVAVAIGAGLYLHRWGWGAPAWRAAVRGPGDLDADTRLIRAITLGSAAAVLAGLTLFTLVAPVHIWDALAYHMPMVASYVQNASLDVWPAQDLRQVYRVNAGELQMLNIALLARSDAWVELPNLLALVVCLIATFQLAALALPRRALPYLAVALVLSAPQIVVGAGSEKNDLVFTAALLCGFYWAIRAGAAERGGAAVFLALAALSGALAAATKVIGLNVLGAMGILLVALAVRRRVAYRHVLLFGAAAAVGLLLLAGDVYWRNFARSVVPVGVAPGEVYYAIGPANLTQAFRFYVYELGFKRLVMPQVFDHDFLHYGYLFPLLLVAGGAAAVRQLWNRQYVPAALVLASAVLFLSVIAVRLPIRWDQRFMIWIVPILAILALTLDRRVHARYLLVLTAVAATLGVVNTVLTLTNEADALFSRSAHHLVTTGSLPRYVDVTHRRFESRSEGYEVLEREATPRDSVLYAGSEDTWMYPAWGARFARHVEGVWDAEHAAAQVATRRFRFLIVEQATAREIREAMERHAPEAGYGVLVRAEHRVIMVRDGGTPHRLAAPGEE
jgi:energy-converting hydrogenase Eha subunit A